MLLPPTLKRDGASRPLFFRARFYREASQTRDYCVAKNAPLRRASLAQGRLLRAARPDHALREEPLLGMTIAFC
jgi:hypothetical protein